MVLRLGYHLAAAVRKQERNSIIKHHLACSVLFHLWTQKPSQLAEERWHCSNFVDGCNKPWSESGLQTVACCIWMQSCLTLKLTCPLPIPHWSWRNNWTVHRYLIFWDFQQSKSSTLRTKCTLYAGLSSGVCKALNSRALQSHRESWVIINGSVFYICGMNSYLEFDVLFLLCNSVI